MDNMRKCATENINEDNFISYTHEQTSFYKQNNPIKVVCGTHQSLHNNRATIVTLFHKDKRDRYTPSLNR